MCIYIYIIHLYIYIYTSVGPALKVQGTSQEHQLLKKIPATQMETALDLWSNRNKIGCRRKVSIPGEISRTQPSPVEPNRTRPDRTWPNRAQPSLTQPSPTGPSQA